jgi:hypothetical protein
MGKPLRLRGKGIPIKDIKNGSGIQSAEARTAAANELFIGIAHPFSSAVLHSFTSFNRRKEGSL